MSRYNKWAACEADLPTVRVSAHCLFFVLFTSFNTTHCTLHSHGVSPRISPPARDPTLPTGDFSSVGIHYIIPADFRSHGNLKIFKMRNGKAYSCATTQLPATRSHGGNVTGGRNYALK